MSATDLTADEGFTISQLASLKGVGEGTLRMWETRHGAKPRRLHNGHRRYSQQDIELVRAAAGHRRDGLAVPAALQRARAAITASPESLFAALREARPQLVPQTCAARCWSGSRTRSKTNAWRGRTTAC